MKTNPVRELRKSLWAQVGGKPNDSVYNADLQVVRGHYLRQLLRAFDNLETEAFSQEEAHRQTAKAYNKVVGALKALNASAQRVIEDLP